MISRRRVSRFLTSGALFAAAGLSSAALPSAAALGAEPRVTVGSLVIEQAWSRATPGGASVGVGYLTVTNTGRAPDTLTAGTASIASGVELHQTSERDGVMRMRALPDGLTIKPGETVKLAPGGAHLMFTGLKQGLRAGETFKATLEFKSAGRVEVEFKVAPIGATAPP